MTDHSSAVVVVLGLIAGAGLLAGCSWVAERFADDNSPGRALFVVHCADCHQAPHPELHKQPPKLEGLFQSKTLPSGAPSTDAQVRNTIIDGLGTMPAFDQRLSEKDVNDLIEYLHTLK